jgi:hypothetical protein
MGREQSIDGTPKIYRCNTNHLYIGNKLSIDGKQTMCSQHTDHVFFFFQSCIYLWITLSINDMLIFVRFFSSCPAIGRKYRILIMHKIQSVSPTSFCRTDTLSFFTYPPLTLRKRIRNPLMRAERGFNRQVYVSSSYESTGNSPLTEDLHLSMLQ